MSNDQNRVRKGVSTGGQYATESRNESGVELSGPTPDLVVPNFEDQVRLMAVRRAGDSLRMWERANRNKGLQRELGVPKPLAKDLADAKVLHELPRKRQEELLEPEQAHLLNKEQSYGRGRVQVAKNFNPDPRNAMLGMAAQAEIERSGIPGKITFTSLQNDRATFAVEHQGISQDVEMTESYLAYKPSNLNDGDATDYIWRERAITKFNGASVYDGPGSTMLRTMRDHHANAMLHETVNESPLREQHQHIVGLDLGRKRATLRSGLDNPKYHLHMSGDEPKLTDGMGRPIEPKVSAAFLDDMARTAGQPNAAAYVGEFRKVFAKTEQRLGE